MGKIVQTELHAADTTGNTVRQMVTWLEADKGIKAGDTITLKDLPGIWWEVKTVGRSHERSDIKRGWGMTDYIGKEKDRAGS